MLTSDICVERKAVPDLISSLDSGRLYSQAVAMCRHYTTPVLLIEFDPKKAFALQSISDMGMEIRGSNVMSKLVILLLNFPKLRCVSAYLLCIDAVSITSTFYETLYSLVRWVLSHACTGVTENNVNDTRSRVVDYSHSKRHPSTH